jgi:hypothetical protein
MHHPPYSSGKHGGIEWMNWPFQEWGAQVVLAAHDHSYERILDNGLPIIINGLGGGPRYDFRKPVDGSQVRFNANYGALRVEADPQQLFFQFITRTGEVIDSYTLIHNQ